MQCKFQLKLINPSFGAIGLFKIEGLDLQCALFVTENIFPHKPAIQLLHKHVHIQQKSSQLEPWCILCDMEVFLSLWLLLRSQNEA